MNQFSLLRVFSLKGINVNHKKRISGVSTALSQTQQIIQNNKSIIEEPKTHNYSIKIANTVKERDAAFTLAYKTYLEKGFIQENESKRHICEYDFNHETVILIVQDKEKNIVGSATLVFEENFEIPAKKVYPEEMGLIKKVSKKNTEICRFVINSNSRYSKEILILLFNYAAIYIHKVKKYDGLVIEVNPRHKNYYKELMHFDEIGTEKQCPQVQDAPGILLFLSASKYHNIIENQKYEIKSNKKSRSLFPFFLKPEQENLVGNYLARQVKPMNDLEKEHFGYLEKNQPKKFLLQTL